VVNNAPYCSLTLVVSITSEWWARVTTYLVCYTYCLPTSE